MRSGDAGCRPGFRLPKRYAIRGSIRFALLNRGCSANRESGLRFAQKFLQVVLPDRRKAGEQPGIVRLVTDQAEVNLFARIFATTLSPNAMSSVTSEASGLGVRLEGRSWSQLIMNGSYYLYKNKSFDS